jgi:hypothetical protein
MALSVPALAALAPAARAADAVEFSGAVGVTRDDNIFRLREGVDVPDTYRRAAAGLVFDLPVRAQHFTLEGRFENYQYLHYTDLDHDAYSGKAGWQWRLGSRLDGRFNYEITSTQTSFSNLQGGVQITVPNEQLSHRARAEVGYGIGRRVQLRAAVDRLEQDNDSAAYATSDMTRNGAELSLALAGKIDGNRIGVTARTEDATLPNRQLVVRRMVDNSYRQLRAGAFLDFAPGERTVLRLRSARVERKHDELPRRDFAAWTWSAALQWEATSRFTLVATVRDDISEYEEVNVGLVTVRGVALQPYFTVNDRMSVSLDLEANRRTYRGDAAQVGAPLEERLDVQQLNFTWQATRLLGFNLAARSEQRRSARAGDFKARMGSAEVRLTF